VADYSVVFARSASKELRSLDSTVALRIVKRIETLSQNPRPAGVVMLEGAADLWRVRVGDWRVVYRIADGRCVRPYSERAASKKHVGDVSDPVRDGPLAHRRLAILLWETVTSYSAVFSLSLDAAFFSARVRTLIRRSK